MKVVISAISLLATVAAPAMATSEVRATRPRSPGTVYRVQHDLGRVQVMDHQERIFVISSRDLHLRYRARSAASRTLRTGDQVWFSTVAGS